MALTYIHTYTHKHIHTHTERGGVRKQTLKIHNFCPIKGINCSPTLLKNLYFILLLQPNTRSWIFLYFQWKWKLQPSVCKFLVKLAFIIKWSAFKFDLDNCSVSATMTSAHVMLFLNYVYLICLCKLINRKWGWSNIFFKFIFGPIYWPPMPILRYDTHFSRYLADTDITDI